MAKNKLFSLSTPQKSIWNMEKFFEDTTINNICASITILDELNVDVFQEAVNRVVKKNDSFRIKIIIENNTPVQYISEFEPFSIDVINLKEDVELEKIKNDLVNYKFNILDSNLFRFKIVKFDDGHGMFLFCVHHIIADSWSLGLFTTSIMQEYKLLLNKEPLSDESNSYIDYISSEEDYFKSKKYDIDKSYWKETLENLPELVTIPGSKEINTNTDCNSKRLSFRIDFDVVQNIKDFCAQNNISVFNFFMAIYSIYLSKISRLDEFIVGTPILNRSNFKEKNTMGMFVNTIPVKINLIQNSDFYTFAHSLGLNMIKNLKHQKYSYSKVLEDLRAQNPSITNLYNIVLSYQVTKAVNKEDGNYTTAWYGNQYSAADCTIQITDINDTGELVVYYDYLDRKYTSKDISYLHSRIDYMMKQVLENINISISNIQIVTEKEKNIILNNFNDTATAYPQTKTIINLLEDQAEKNPDNIAVIFENQQLTYKELNEKANNLAYYLRTNATDSHDVISILLNRSLELIISIFGVIKSGASFVLIDPSLPEERINYIINDSNTKFCIVSNSTKDNINFNSKINIDYFNNSSNHINNLNIPYEDNLCIIYTSGSTGKPKGVQLHKHGYFNLINAFDTNMQLSCYKRSLGIANISFDMFVFEVFAPILLGNTLVLANFEEQKDPIAMSKLIKSNNVEFFVTTPSRVELLLLKECENPLQNVKAILLGGEKFTSSLYNRLKEATNANIYNSFGPTEITSACTNKLITSSDITVGKALPNMQVYICDTNTNLLPIGVVGEICVTGQGVSNGYLNNEKMTEKNFVKNPFGLGNLYKTGDLGRYLENGEIQYIDRLDNQVKIRGLRIELGEIENKILEISSINSCVVIKKGNNLSHEFLCAYFTATDQIDISVIRKFLEKSLPQYMVPNFFMQLEKLPYTPNGKIDRKKLPEINYEKNKTIQIRMPRNTTDKKLITILENILNIKNITIDDSFFDLGGDSLSAINLCITLQSEFNCQISVKDILNSSKIQDISDIINKNTEEVQKETIIPKIDNQDYYPTSSAQRRIYYASQFASSDSLIYNSAGGIILSGRLNSTKLEKCIQKLIDRHEILRTYFSIENKELVQKIIPKIDFQLEVLKNQNFDNLNNLFYEFVKPFNLFSTPLFRTQLIEFTNKKYAFFLDIHHIISDGVSTNILIDELCKLYNGETLEELEITYKDFASYEKNKLSQEEMKEAENYWINQFKDEIPVLNMPTFQKRPAIQSFEGNKIYSNINEQLAEKIKRISNELEITPYMFLLSAYYILLQKYTSQNDITIGSPIVGRTIPQTNNILGMFVNTLALRNKINTNNSFKEFSLQIKHELLEAIKYQDYPFDELINKLKLKRDSSRNPLFDTMFIYQNHGLKDANFKDIQSNFYIPPVSISKFDLSLEILPINNELKVTFEYATKLFTKSFIQNMSKHYLNILNNIIENPDIKLSEIDFISKEEESKILYDFNNRQASYNKSKSISEIFENQVENNPDNLAIIFEDQKITYKELNEKANCFANYLISNEITNKNVVAILLTRSLDLIVSILGVIKTGASYVLIDTTLPEERIRYIIDDSQSKFCITNNITKNLIDQNIAINIDKMTFSIFDKHNLKIEKTDNLSIIYTSGSTGNPKGVLLHHKGFINLINAFNDEMEIGKYKRILGIATVSFDMFAVELFSSILLGNTLVLANEEEQKNPVAMSNLIQKNDVEFLVTTPSRIELLLLEENAICLRKLKAMQLGGEKFTSELFEKLRKNTDAKIFNGYGPTEITACCTNKLVDSPDVTIGKPLPNVNVFICNENQKLLPVGIVGEICVSGQGVSNGYLNNLKLTTKNFVKNPFGDGFLYRTGDLGKFRENGEIEYIDRIDTQVKIRGLRIELGEIESYITKYPNIEKAIVVKQNTNNRDFLTAYFISSKVIVINELRKYLSKYLPSYMVPSYYVALDKFEHTTNGKIDKKSLPIPTEVQNMTNEEFVAPKTIMQRKLAHIWENILQTKPIGINDNFFELGGDSLLAMNLNMELLKITSKISYSDIFHYPTIAELEEKINSDNDKTVFSKIENLPDNYVDVLNNSTKKGAIKKYQPKGVLLTGATGFLGVHILEQLIQNDINVFCIVREHPGITVTTKLTQKLNYYFGNKYNELINKKIFAIGGDISKPDFGVSSEQLLNLSVSVDLVINCAANVSHYGNYKEFYNTNVKSAKYAIQFCKDFNKKLYHISTTGVSGNELDTSYLKLKRDKKTSIKFSESSLYVGQVLNNVYARSKFEAENLVLNAVINDNLDAYVLRMGNLMPRYNDGIFQENVSKNAFITRFAAFIQIGCVPNYILKLPLNFTPVDYAANAVYKLIAHPSTTNRIFHIINSKNISTKKYLNSLEKDYHIEILDEKDFIEKINQVINNNTEKNILNNILNDFDNHLHLTYKSDIMTSSKFTEKYLRKIGFRWPRITKEYLNKFNNVLRRLYNDTKE